MWKKWTHSPTGYSWAQQVSLTGHRWPFVSQLVLLPVLKPCEQLLNIWAAALLPNDVLRAGRLVLVNPHEGLQGPAAQILGWDGLCLGGGGARWRTFTLLFRDKNMSQYYCCEKEPISHLEQTAQSTSEIYDRTELFFSVIWESKFGKNNNVIHVIYNNEDFHVFNFL